VLLGFDPGKDKCGVAVMGLDRKLHFQQVVASAEAIAKISELRQTYPIASIIIGNQTTAKQWKDNLAQAFPQQRIISIDERYSSQEARDRYWQMYPPKGLLKLMPKGMRLPPRPVDDIVAVILIERYLNRLIS
jgi:RNase H-fold protein (predicted Holliday junction resolvase)